MYVMGIKVSRQREKERDELINLSQRAYWQVTRLTFNKEFVAKSDFTRWSNKLKIS